MEPTRSMVIKKLIIGVFLSVPSIILPAQAETNIPPAKRVRLCPGTLMLTQAALTGDTKLAQELLALEGSDQYINAAGPNGRTPLGAAAENGQIGVLRLLLAKKPFIDVEKRSADGWTPLHIATRKGHAEAVRLLIEAGANPNEVSPHSQNSLMIAVGEKNLEVARAILSSFKNQAEKEAYLNTLDPWGFSALIIAASKGSPEMTEFLLEQGAFPGKYPTFTQLPLVQAAAQGHTTTVAAMLNKLKELGKLEQYINQQATGNYTALNAAARNNHYDIAKMLLNAGADQGIANHSLETPLINAAEKGNISLVALLLGRLSSQDSKISHLYRSNNEEKTPITAAAERGHGKIVQMLIQTVSDPAQQKRLANQTLNGWGILADAAINRQTELVRFLIEKGAQLPPTVMRASWEGNLPIIETIFAALPTQQARMALLRETDNEGWTPLMMAASTNKVELIHFFLNLFDKSEKRMAYISQQDSEQNSALEHASQERHLEATQALIEAGADAGKALINASFEEHFDAVETLLEAGAHINSTEQETGSTALMGAATTGNTHIARVLLERGASKDITDKDGDTALDIARREGHQEIVGLLEARHSRFPRNRQ